MKSVILMPVSISDFLQAIKEQTEGYIDEAILKFKNQNELTSPAHSAILSRKEAAKRLGVSLVTLHNWVKTGKVKSHKIGGSVRFKEEDVMAALQEQKFGTFPRNMKL